MNKFIRGAVAAMLATAPAAAFANTVDGNLNVTTTISVSCDAPSPSGTLNLPFSSTTALDDQALANTPVTVTVTCFGNPTVNHVDFDGGNNRDGAERDENGVRYMRRSGTDGNDEKDFLGYKLFASMTEATSSEIQSSGTAILTGTGENDNRLDLGESFNEVFRVTGKVFESSARTGAFGDPTDAETSGAVPGGTYNDTVVMTVSFN